MIRGPVDDKLLQTESDIKPHLKYNSHSCTNRNLSIHPENKIRSNWIGHNKHIPVLAKHVLRKIPHADKLVDKIFSKKVRFASPLTQKNHDIRFGIPWRN